VRPKAPRQYIKTVTPAVRIKKQRPPDRRKAALWAFCFSLSSFPHRFVKGHDRASLGILASLWQVTGKLNGRPGRYSRAARFSRAIARFARIQSQKQANSARFARIQSQNKLFSRVFRYQVQLFRSHGLNSFSKLLSSCKQLPDHFRHVTKKVRAMSSWRRANIRLSI
jgi:hypothetical protein